MASMVMNLKLTIVHTPSITFTFGKLIKQTPPIQCLTMFVLKDIGKNSETLSKLIRHPLRSPSSPIVSIVLFPGALIVLRANSCTSFLAFALVHSLTHAVATLGYLTITFTPVPT